MPSVTQLHINGIVRQIDAEATRSLLGVLRDDLDLTGSNYGCGEGQCGACTVLLDGAPTRSCITPVRAAEGKQITTIEGLEKDGKLHPLQEAFLELDAMQCAYCTSGMLMSGRGAPAKKSRPVRARDPPRPGRQHLPMRHVLTYRRGRSKGRAIQGRRWK